MTDAPKRHRTPAESLAMARSHTARLAVVLAIVAVLALGFAPFGVHEAMFDLDYAVGVVVFGWASNLALGAVVVGIVALLMALLVPPRRGFILPLVALALGAGALAVVGQVKARAAAVPPLHDVATDWKEPLLFGPAFLAQRGPEANAAGDDPRVGINHIDWRFEQRRVADLNAQTCPAALPAMIMAAPEQAFAKARQALVSQGYTLVTENLAAGRLEATTQTKWLKLVGDVVVRVRPEGAGARVDIRSVSRTGEIDLGENCRRVANLRKAVEG